eukprot:GHVT01038914.1.p1 GENE.GHVT01038914.1~~GHVT01038914.1.p1  ORF type:complete len:353 (+),score=120.38 GHVT01038914.1:796-1854(+)
MAATTATSFPSSSSAHNHSGDANTTSSSSSSLTLSPSSSSASLAFATSAATPPQIERKDFEIFELFSQNGLDVAAVAPDSPLTAHFPRAGLSLLEGRQGTPVTGAEGVHTLHAVGGSVCTARETADDATPTFDIRLEQEGSQADDFDSAPPLLLESLWVRQQLQTEASELLSFATRRLTETSVESSGGGEAEGTRAGARGPFQGGAGLPAVAGGASEASTAAAAAAAHAAIPLQLLHTAKQLAEWQQALREVLEVVTASQTLHLIHVKQSKAHLTRVVSRLVGLRAAAVRAKGQAAATAQRAADLRDEAARLQARLLGYKASAKELQKIIEEGLSKIYNDTPVLLTGEINRL